MDFTLRAMTRQDWPEVAELIHVSTNFWYRASGRSAIFAGDPAATELFCSVYETLDPGCCVVAVNTRTGRLAGSCFYHPRTTHVSLGIMNVHPNYFGMGIASRLLRFIIDVAEIQHKPLRLVSSAMNLDSFSLYTRAGFVPRSAYQDMILAVPANGIQEAPQGHSRVREARTEDAEAIADLEQELNHIRREGDYRYFLSNQEGIWHTSVVEREGGGLDGFLVSVAHPASNMIGPGVCRTQEVAAALIYSELNRNRGRQPVCLVPTTCETLVQQMYRWGAQNCEIHFSQVRGDWQAPEGVVMPTFYAGDRLK